MKSLERVGTVQNTIPEALRKWCRWIETLWFLQEIESTCQIAWWSKQRTLSWRSESGSTMSLREIHCRKVSNEIRVDWKSRVPREACDCSSGGTQFAHCVLPARCHRWNVCANVQEVRLNVKEFTDFDNQWVYVPVHWVSAQQCVEWPDALQKSTHRDSWLQEAMLRVFHPVLHARYIVGGLATLTREFTCTCLFWACARLEFLLVIRAVDAWLKTLSIRSFQLSHGKVSADHIWTPSCQTRTRYFLYENRQCAAGRCLSMMTRGRRQTRVCAKLSMMPRPCTVVKVYERSFRVFLWFIDSYK